MIKELVTIDGKEVRITVFRVDLKLHIDLWGGEYAFGDSVTNELTEYWLELFENPTGEPEQSRAGLGISPAPTVISADFVCKADLEAFEAKALELIKDPEPYVDVAKMKAEYLAEQEKLKTEADEAAATIILNNQQDDGTN